MMKGSICCNKKIQQLSVLTHPTSERLHVYVYASNTSRTKRRDKEQYNNAPRSTMDTSPKQRIVTQTADLKTTMSNGLPAPGEPSL